MIASTNHDLRENFRVGKFGLGSLYRLSTRRDPGSATPGREEDILLLANHLIANGNIPVSLSVGAMETLISYSWPGNVEELRNVLHGSVFWEWSGEIRARIWRRSWKSGWRSIPGGRLPFPCRKVRGRKGYLLGILKRHQFNLSLAARRLGISRGTLYSRIKNTVL